jgi:hypothetical protein
MTTNANLYVDQGIDFAVVLDLFDAEGQDFNIEEQQFKCEIRKIFSSSVAFEAVVVVNTDDNDNNNLDLLIPGNLTEEKEPGKYQYDIVMYDGSRRVKILEGLLFLLPTMTKSG